MAGEGEDASSKLLEQEVDDNGTLRRRHGGDAESSSTLQNSNPKASEIPTPTPTPTSSLHMVTSDGNPFYFWLGFMAMVTIITLVMMAGTGIVSGSEKPEILSMPFRVREHFEAGKLVKVELGFDRSPIKAFVRTHGDSHHNRTVFLLPGLGSTSFSFRKVLPFLESNNLHTVVIDLPGSGLAQKSKSKLKSKSQQQVKEEEEEFKRGFFTDRVKAFKELFTEGLFARPGEEGYESDFLAKMKMSAKIERGKEGLVLTPEDLEQALDQIVMSLELEHVHLVVHDTGAEVGLAWASRNPGKVGSITIVDAVPQMASLPFWMFRVPVLGVALAHSDFAFRWVLRSCCFSSVSPTAAEEYGYLFRSNGGVRAAVETLDASNSSMEVAAWANNVELKAIPKQILWASVWSERWQKEGEQLAAQLPDASFHAHRGSRWPQEDAAAEISEQIADFVNSLPPSLHEVGQPELPKHTEEILLEKIKDSTSHEPSYTESKPNKIRDLHHSHGQAYMGGPGQPHGVGHGGWVL